jgi:uncharacterized repeat protein (TIGR03803 family)
MKTSTKSLFALIAGLGLMAADRVAAQTFTNLHNFTGGTNGGNPAAGLILSGNTFYGTAQDIIESSYGTVFAISTNGTNFTTLYSFTNGSDGSEPVGGLILSGNTLYGTASLGGSSGGGTVFAVNTNGSGFTNLHSCDSGTNGEYPCAGLILSGNTLYGTTQYGGSNGNGMVFAVNTNGTGFTNLYSFTAEYDNEVIDAYTNSDGAWPYAGLILLGNTLYGTTQIGGTNGNGTIFAVNTNGMCFTNVHSFTVTSGGNESEPFTGTNSDGANPHAGLILSGNTLYGTAAAGGSSGFGTVFAVSTDGTCFTNLYSFTNGSDGAAPIYALTLSGNTLYGTAGGGGISHFGTVFAVNTNGTGFTILYSFTAPSNVSPYGNSDGIFPHGGVVLSGNTLYGTAFQGGTNGYGTVFGLSLPVPPPLSIILSGANVILTWTNTAFEFTLQSTTNLSPPAWSNVSPAPVVVNGQNTVTNPICGTQQFYQLSQ